MKKLFALFALACALVFQSAQAGQNSVLCRETEVRINEVPLPRKNQIGVVWEKVNGSWATEDFIFELGAVVRQGSKRFISVQMMNPLTGEILRKGGIAIRADGMRASGIVTDAVASSNGRKPDDTFVIFRAFKETDSQGRPTNRDLFVVTIRTLREKVRVCDETHHQLVRHFVSDN